MTPVRYTYVDKEEVGGCILPAQFPGWVKYETGDFFHETYSVKWDLRFLRLAREIASWSHDPSTQVGAVAVDKEHGIIATGYNGFSKKNLDRPEDYQNRNRKLMQMIHAEENLLLFAEKNRLKHCTLYTYPFIPCGTCAAKLLQVDIDRVVSLDGIPDRWLESFNCGREQFADAGVIVDYYPVEFLNV
jgi:dCMP deaminase